MQREEFQTKLRVLIPVSLLTSLRASAYEPGQPGWLGFRDLAYCHSFRRKNFNVFI